MMVRPQVVCGQKSASAPLRGQGKAGQRLLQEAANLAGDVVHPAAALCGDVKGKHAASCAEHGGRCLHERGTGAPESAGDGQGRRRLRRKRLEYFAFEKGKM